MRNGEIVELEIPSSPEYVSIVRQAVEGIAKRMEFGMTQIEDLKVAVGEACTNAVKYGCPRGDAHNVEIRCVVHPTGLEIEIRNNIQGCECPRVPAHPDLTREGGLGLYLMHELMDEVDISWDKEMAVVRMFKALTPNAA